MLAQQASGYDIGGWNFHIKREPMHYIATSRSTKLARPVLEPARPILLYVVADEPARPVLETGQAGLPVEFSSNRLKLLLIDAKADSSDWRAPIIAYLRDPSIKVDKKVR